MALYTFSIPRAHINQIRSAHTDTLYASTALRVMNANGSLHRDYGAQTVGLNEHKAGGDAFPNLQWVNVDVPDPTPENPDGGAISWTFLLANAGHQGSGFVDVFNKASDAFAGAAAGQVLDGNLAGLAELATVLGVQELVNTLTADCDGMVAVGNFAFTAAQLAGMAPTPPQKWTSTQDNPGTNSPAGCGANSDYIITYEIVNSAVTDPIGASGRIAAQHQWPAVQLNVAVVDRTGSLMVSWVQGDNAWSGPIRLQGPGFAPANAKVALAPQASLHQLDAFVVDNTGALSVFWVIDDAGQWSGPLKISPSNFAPPGAGVALGHQVSIEQLDAVIVDNTGALSVFWVQGDGNWQGPLKISPPNFAPPGASVALAHQISTSQLDALVADNTGALSVFWVQGDGHWQGPLAISPPNFSLPGANLALAHQISLDQLDAVVVDNSGSLSVFWVQGGGNWRGPLKISAASFAPPGASLAMAHQVSMNQLNVVVADNSSALLNHAGALSVFWVEGGGQWQGPLAISPSSFVRPGASVALAHQVTMDQLDAFVPDASGALSVFWVEGDGNWQGPLQLPGPLLLE